MGDDINTSKTARSPEKPQPQALCAKVSQLEARVKELEQENFQLRQRVVQSTSDEDQRRIDLLVSDRVKSYMRNMKVRALRMSEVISNFASQLDADGQELAKFESTEVALGAIPHVGLPKLMKVKHKPVLEKISESPLNNILGSTPMPTTPESDASFATPKKLKSFRPDEQSFADVVDENETVNKSVELTYLITNQERVEVNLDITRVSTPSPIAHRNFHSTPRVMNVSPEPHFNNSDSTNEVNYERSFRVPVVSECTSPKSETTDSQRLPTPQSVQSHDNSSEEARPRPRRKAAPVPGVLKEPSRAKKLRREK